MYHNDSTKCVTSGSVLTFLSGGGGGGGGGGGVTGETPNDIYTVSKRFCGDQNVF